MKERIIGAVVLVLFVVLVVPVFLDGPPDNAEIVSERVPLPGQSDQELRTIVLERDRTEPVPAANGNQAPTQSAAVAAEPEPERPRPEPETVQEPVREPEPAQETKTASATAASTSPTGMWAVQLGSFGSQENAERLAADLRKQGHAAFLSQLATGSGQLHRVRIGPQEDRKSAEAVAAELQKAGHNGQVVPHP